MRRMRNLAVQTDGEKATELSTILSGPGVVT